ncbi:MAG TPA: response regulator [Blastocatellia bacterium]|nr:response regulator [Blastocatellia bacterium]
MQKTCVLVAEDNDDQRELYTLFLELNGFEVKAVANGKEALQALENNCPDVILTDIAMPEMTGLELIERVRSHQKLSQIPIIVITDFDRHYLEWALCLGANETLSKPLDPEDLFMAIFHVLPERVGH